MTIRKVNLKELPLDIIIEIMKLELHSRTDYVWETKTKQKVSIKEMETAHIINTIKMLENAKEEYDIIVAGIPSDD